MPYLPQKNLSASTQTQAAGKANSIRTLEAAENRRLHPLWGALKPVPSIPEISQEFCKTPAEVEKALRTAGITNPVYTDNSWSEFYEKKPGTKHSAFSINRLKEFLYNKGAMTKEQLNSRHWTPRGIIDAVWNCMRAGNFPIKCSPQKGIEGYSPIRASYTFSGKMKGMRAFTTLSVINPFCLARMEQKDLVCYYCYVPSALRKNIVGALNYIQNFYLMTRPEGIPDILIPLLSPTNANLKKHREWRIEAFGDVYNQAQQMLYTKLAYKNPKFLFSQWTKNPAILCDVFNQIGKPDNLIFGLSMKRINKLDNDLSRWISTGYLDFLFGVTDRQDVYNAWMSYPHSRRCSCSDGSCAGSCKKENGGTDCYTRNDNLILVGEWLRRPKKNIHAGTLIRA